MDRRKTLAGLSPSQINSRASLAPGRVAKPGPGGAKLPLDKAMSRLSLAGPVQRRSSTYTNKAAGVKQDPRPVSDKLFQQNCSRVIITYLAAHSYEFTITPKVTACTHSGCGVQTRSAECRRAPPPPTLPCTRRCPGAGQPHHQGLCQHHALPLPPSGPQPERQEPGQD